MSILNFQEILGGIEEEVSKLLEFKKILQYNTQTFCQWPSGLEIIHK